MSTAFAFVPSLAHTLHGHPERAARFEEIWRVFEKAGVLGLFDHVAWESASMEQLKRVHTQSHIDLLKWAAAEGGGFIDNDTYVTPHSFEAARNAAGAAAAVADVVAAGRARNGLALVRPPGHHASADKAEGFCLLNNVAVAARQAQAQPGIRRILLVDFDVHHGNGTQAIFYDDPSVMFVSLHQYGGFFYPGSGTMQELGLSVGHGWTLNVPFPAGVGNVGYRQVFEQVISAKAEFFRPDMIIVSAGFDAHWRDPLAHTRLCLNGFSALVHTLIEWAEAWCNGRIVFVSEGGYDREVLAHGLLNTAYALLARDEVLDPVGSHGDQTTDVAHLLQLLRQVHLY